MPTKLWAVRSALKELYIPALGSAVDEVFEGPRPKGTAPKKFLIVGARSSLVDESGPASRSAQQPAATGDGSWREEAGEIDCVAAAWSGVEDLEPLRDAVIAIVDICEIALKAHPQLDGLLVPADYQAEPTAFEITEARTTKGPYVEAMFTVSYGTVLTS